jgi:hypothetical protein
MVHSHCLSRHSPQCLFCNSFQYPFRPSFHYPSPPYLNINLGIDPNIHLDLYLKVYLDFHLNIPHFLTNKYWSSVIRPTSILQYVSRYYATRRLALQIGGVLYPPASATSLAKQRSFTIKSIPPPHPLLLSCLLLYIDRLTTGRVNPSLPLFRRIISHATPSSR